MYSLYFVGADRWAHRVPAYVVGKGSFGDLCTGSEIGGHGNGGHDDG